MALRSQDLFVYQGDDYAAMVNVTNSDGSIPDLTGYTAQSQIRAGVADQEPLVTIEIDCTVVLPNQISLYISHQQTTLLNAPAYVWDLQITSAAGEITTLLNGNVNVTLEVTREPGALAFRRETRTLMFIEGGPVVIR